MKSYLSVLLLICLIFISAQTFAQDDMSMYKNRIAEMNDMYVKATMNNDINSIVGYYADDAISLQSYSPMLKGKDAIKKHAMEESQSGSKITAFNLNTTDVFGSGDLVYDIGTYTITYEMPQMKEPISDHGKYLTVYKKEPDGSLKVKAETWNSDVNPWMSMNEDMNKMKDK